MSRVNPGLIYCSASGFGQTGPYSQRAGLDLIVQGMSGLMSITGEPGGAPVKVGVPIADLTAALFGSYAILAAYAPAEDRRGQTIDVSLFESAVALGVWETSGYFATGECPAARLRPPGLGAVPGVPHADGYITIGATTPELVAAPLPGDGQKPELVGHLARLSPFAIPPARSTIVHPDSTERGTARSRRLGPCWALSQRGTDGAGMATNAPSDPAAGLMPRLLPFAHSWSGRL